MSNPLTLANPIQLNNSIVTFNANGVTLPFEVAVANTGVTVTSFNIPTNQTVTFTGAIAGGASEYVLTGSGTLVSTGVGTYTGLTDIVAGTVVAGNSSALGNVADGVIVNAGTTLDVESFTGGGVVLTKPMALAGSLVMKAGGTGADTLAGNLTLLGDATINVPTGVATISGTIQGSYGLAKTGPGELVLGGGNTFFGTRTASAGILDLTGTNALGGIESSTTITDGASLYVNASQTGQPITITGQGGRPAAQQLPAAAGRDLVMASATPSGNITTAASNTNNPGFSSAFALVANSGQTLTIVGIVSGGSENILKSGLGTVTLQAALTRSAAKTWWWARGAATAKHE